MPSGAHFNKVESRVLDALVNAPLNEQDYEADGAEQVAELGEGEAVTEAVGEVSGVEGGESGGEEDGDDEELNVAGGEGVGRGFR